MVVFCKSKFSEFKQCPKASWLHEHKIDVYNQNASVEAYHAYVGTGKDVYNLAKGLFGVYVEVPAPSPDGDGLESAAELTRKYIAEGQTVICGAAFVYDGFYCAVDILKKTQNGYSVYAVTSGTISDKYDDIIDMCYRKYILDSLGIAVDGVYVVTINDEYVLDGEIDIHKLFNITDVSALVKKWGGRTERDLLRAKETLFSDDEPNTDLSHPCAHSHKCGYWNYCGGQLSSPSSVDLYHMPTASAKVPHGKTADCSSGVTDGDTRFNGKVKRRLELALDESGTYVNRKGINAFLKSLSFPLYFIDFEVVKPPVPLYSGTRPFQMIPVQYSLHALEAEDGEIKHLEFLGRPESDPRREFAERLVKTIPEGACLLAYNKKFECTILNELADIFPDLAPQLTKINNNIKDLLEPFKEGHYYKREMGGSFSIRSVLPAIFPDDPELDYGRLEGVHTGREAMVLFSTELKRMPDTERKIAERNLLKHCELDTFVLVKIWQELVRAARA
ncbi:MAG: DUF2779 domain-containing protein [Clostridiales bacterium]|nr:DUF2779 domain-containing protein [Clostridiales bacterium]